MKITTFSEEETIEYGRSLGTKLTGGEIICLTGDLGAGKTHLTKGIALALDIDEPVTSPSFVLVKIYKGRLNLVHIDFYRLSSMDDLETIGFDESILQGF